MSNDLLSKILGIASGEKATFQLSWMGATHVFRVYFDSEEARGDMGQRAPGFITGEYEVWLVDGEGDDSRDTTNILRQHVSPGKPGGMQQCYAAERCAEAMMARAWARRTA